MITDYTLSEIYIYPVKSLGGIKVLESEVTDRGLKHDRMRMLIDADNNFLSQRNTPEMALLQTELNDEYIRVFHKHNPKLEIKIPLELNPKTDAPYKKVLLWDESVNVKIYKQNINEWFRDILKIECRLVYMPFESKRLVDIRYAFNGEIASLSDGYPFLILGQESLNLLNSKLQIKLPIDRFRPNFVFTGGEPHDEDTWQNFTIGPINFKVVKPCSRCVITTTNQDSGKRGKEPLKTLAAYRTQNNKVMFGQNLVHSGTGYVKVSDKIHLK